MGPSVLDLLSITRAALWIAYHINYVEKRLYEAILPACDMNDIVDPVYGRYWHAKQGELSSLSAHIRLLAFSQNLLSAEPVDKVYGILSLTKEIGGELNLDIRPDTVAPLRTCSQK